MAIDGIGKRGGVTSGAPTSGPTQLKGKFELDAQAAHGHTGPTAAAAGSEAFAALERGEISVQQYLDARVESAVAPLLSRLSSEQLEFVRGELRTALENDPVLVELVQRATGSASRSE